MAPALYQENYYLHFQTDTGRAKIVSLIPLIQSESVCAPYKSSSINYTLRFLELLLHGTTVRSYVGTEKMRATMNLLHAKAR